ncbi:MAG: NAD(P)/FAD-dependent oxidoreductase [Proteobacteria bacterium]|nr:NAD(P)/FAD-dependent oxidoreductase [Pseudomonadota bacterium]
MKNAVIIGAGPAGITAAIYLIRAGIPTTVIYKDMGALGKTQAIDNYYGFPETISGPELFERGLAQARRLGVEIIQDEVVGISWEDKMTVLTKTARYPGDVILFATGAARIAPKIEGLKTLEGRGVSYCAVCDAFFYKNRDVAVIGNGEYALHEAEVLSNTSKTVTIYTLGKAPAFELPPRSEIVIDTRKIIRLHGEEALESLELDDGTIVPMDGLFVAVGVAGSADFAKKVGAEVDGARIQIDENCRTTLDGLYAIGDCSGGLLQIAKAVHDGAKAAVHAIKYLQNT